MRLRWPVVASLAPVGILVGAAIVGPPQAVARDVRIIEAPTTTTTAPPTTEVVESAGPPPTGPTAATTTAGLQTTTTQTTQPTSPTELVLSDIAIVVANATSVSGIAASTAETLSGLGFTSTLTTDALPVETTSVYFAPDNETAAGLVAQALGVALDAVLPLPESPLTPIDDQADVVVVVGADRVG